MDVCLCIYVCVCFNICFPCCPAETRRRFSAGYRLRLFYARRFLGARPRLHIYQAGRIAFPDRPTQNRGRCDSTPIVICIHANIHTCSSQLSSQFHAHPRVNPGRIALLNRPTHNRGPCDSTPIFICIQTNIHTCSSQLTAVFTPRFILSASRL